MKNSRGFTLLEIMIVVGILVAVISVAVPRYRKGNSNIKSVVRELGVVSKEVRHQAELKNATYRIVFDLNGQADNYYVEASNRPVLIQSENKQKEIAKLSDKDRPASPFQKTDRPVKGEKKMPDGIFIKSVETRATKDPITKGMAYIHYSPQGLVEQAVVQLTDKKSLTWSLIFNPLTGHADVVNKAVTLKDLETQ